MRSPNGQFDSGSGYHLAVAQRDRALPSDARGRPFKSDRRDSEATTGGALPGCGVDIPRSSKAGHLAVTQEIGVRVPVSEPFIIWSGRSRHLRPHRHRPALPPQAAPTGRSVHRRPAARCRPGRPGRRPRHLHLQPGRLRSLGPAVGWARALHARWLHRLLVHRHVGPRGRGRCHVAVLKRRLPWPGRFPAGGADHRHPRTRQWRANDLFALAGLPLAPGHRPARWVDEVRTDEVRTELCR